MRGHESSCHTSRGGLWCTCVARLYARYDPLDVEDQLRRLGATYRIRQIERRIDRLEQERKTGAR